jgi:hypothetical protein
MKKEEKKGGIWGRESLFIYLENRQRIHLKLASQAETRQTGQTLGEFALFVEPYRALLGKPRRILTSCRKQQRWILILMMRSYKVLQMANIWTSEFLKAKACLLSTNRLVSGGQLFYLD